MTHSAPRTNAPLPAFSLLIAALVLVASAGRPSLAEAKQPDNAERELCELYLAVAEQTVDAFDWLWQEDPNVPNAGFFDLRRYGDWEPDLRASSAIVPGNGMAVLAYAVLLKETDKQVFGKRQLTRQQLLDRAVKTIRWICLTSAYVDNPYPYLPEMQRNMRSGRQWKKPLERSGDYIGYLTLAAAILWDDLDPQTRTLFHAVATGGALRQRTKRVWCTPGGGNHDQVKQEFSSTFGAAFLFDADQDEPSFYLRVTEAGIDMVSTPADRAKNVLAEGKPVKQWSQGWNLYDDFSSDHHGHANIWYGGDMLFEGRCYVDIIAQLTGKRVPETFSYEGNGFDGVLGWLKTLCLAEGGLAHPHGAEYDSYYGAGLLAFCYGATVKQDRIASTLEHQAARLLARHTRALPEYDYFRGSWAKAAMAYLMHKYHGPAAEPLELGQALRCLSGTEHYRDQRCLVHRTPQKWASFSWGSTTYAAETDKPLCRWPPGHSGLCGLVMPQDPDSPAAPLTYCHPCSLTGEIRSHSLWAAARRLAQRVLAQLLGSPRRQQCSAAAVGVLVVMVGLLLVFKRLRRRWMWYVLGAFAAGLLVICCLSIVRTAAAGVRAGNTDIQYRFNRSDDGLSTVGSASCGGVQRRQAFFSFAEGPCVTFLTLLGQENTKISWSGLPVYCYVRPGIADEHTCSYEAGITPLRQLPQARSDWWCIDDRLGAAVIGGTGMIHGGRIVGFNWSRKESYRDKADFVACSSLDHAAVSPGGLVADLSAVFYVNQPQEDVRQCAAGVQDFSQQLPEGWRGLTAPVSPATRERILAVANLYGRQSTAQLQLSLPEGAPVLRQETSIHGSQSSAKIALAPLESHAEVLRWYLKVLDDATVQAAQPAVDRLELTAPEGQVTRLRLRYTGRDGQRIVLTDKARQVVAEVPIAEARAADGVECQVDGYLRVEVAGAEAGDELGPAVEISQLESQPDGGVSVTVLATDRSGIRKVDLYCDDKLVGEDEAAPFQWTCRPGTGWHSFRAVASDGSPKANVKTSFCRTIQVMPGSE